VQELRIARAEAGMTLMELEAASGVGASTISKIERGVTQPQVGTLRKLAQALGVEVEDFFREPAAPLAEAPRKAGPPSAIAIDIAMEAAKRQETANWQAIARAKESGRAQASTVADENEAFMQLRKYSSGDLAEALQEMAKRNLWLAQENAGLQDRLHEREQAHS
jgi:transcriptional regulator with XRE-family HTH domain